MPNYYCKASNDGGSGGHVPWPGDRIIAADPVSAAQAFSTLKNLPQNIKIYVIDEADIAWFVTGGITPIAAPPYV